MASSTSRASAFWSESMDSQYFPPEDQDVEQQQRLVDGNDDSESFDTRTPLDKTIDKIGMGSYQWTLLSLCGFGWMADNMWIQAIAIILPRVQHHYSIPDSYIGAVSSSMFAGMMIGAIGWGTCSDLMGRSTAFNATLFFTALFGLLASFANSFLGLCIILFFLGSSVGGSMPTDGTLLLEHMPKGKQYLVTALSVFFSFGAVLSAVVALLILPKNSCLPSTIPCDVDTQNQGWKYLLITLGLLTLSMFIARMVFFRLHESPRYLVHAGRPQDAVISLQMISRFNGSDLSIELEDVQDHLVQNHEMDKPEYIRPRANSRTIFEAGILEDVTPPSSPPRPRNGNGSTDHTNSHLPSGSRPILQTHYASTGESPVLDVDSATSTDPKPLSPKEAEPNLNSVTHRAERRHPPRQSSVTSRNSQSSCCSSIGRQQKVVLRVLPRWLRKPLGAWWDRVMMVLAPEWLRVTVLVWSAWCAMSLAYTMFNVFLPLLLETRKGSGSEPAEQQTLEGSLWDVVIFTIGGCPGALLGAYLIESRLGRRGSLASSTFITALFCVLFVVVESTWAVRWTTVGISLSATTMWAVLYGWTPEIFGTKVRGTACGIASALSRIGGMIAPLLGGALLMMDRSAPVYVSVVVFAIAGICVLLLKEDNQLEKAGSLDEPPTLVH